MSKILSESVLLVVQELADGATVRQIARRQGVVPHAVSMRLHRACRATGAVSTTQLVAFCVYRGLVKPAPLTQGGAPCR